MSWHTAVVTHLGCLMSLQTAVVTAVHRLLDLELSDGRIFLQMPISAVAPVVPFFPDQYVVKSGWLGRIEEVGDLLHHSPRTARRHAWHVGPAVWFNLLCFLTSKRIQSCLWTYIRSGKPCVGESCGGKLPLTYTVG